MLRIGDCAALVAIAMLGAGCVGFGMFTDGTSASVGTVNDGHLRRGVRIPKKSRGLVVPELWATRGANFGTDEIVRAIVRAGKRVVEEYPGAMLGVADLSPPGGADSPLHRSHRAGRDADLLFYAVDDRGKPVPPPSAMPRYAAIDGHSFAAYAPAHGVVYGPVTPRWFDVPRNWALVRALLQDPEIEVQYLFCNEGLKQRMLEHARNVGEDPALVEEAEVLLRQPSDSLPHDDHLHLRIFCASSDRALGCVDRGPTRWWKKRYKYMAPDGAQSTVDEVVAKLLGLGSG